MHSARLVPLVAAAVLVAAQQDISGTVHMTATTTRYLTIVQCDSALAACPASSSSSPLVQPTPPHAPLLTSAAPSSSGPSVDLTTAVPSVETVSAETATTDSFSGPEAPSSAAAPQSPPYAPSGSWLQSNFTSSAAPSGSGLVSSSAPTEPSATSSAEVPPTVPNRAAGCLQPRLAVAAAAAMVVALVAV